MQNKKNSKIISKLVLSTTAAFMATIAVKATEEPNDVQSQVENFQQEDQLQVAYATNTEGTSFTGKEVSAQYKVTTEDSDANGVQKGNVTLSTYTGTEKEIAKDNKIWGPVSNADTADTSGEKFDVTAIAGEAFKDCDKLVSVDIPTTVTTIGGKAFDGCTKLEYVNIGETESLDNWSADIFGSAKSNVKRVYIEDEEKIKSVATKLDIDESKVAEYTALESTVDSATSVSAPEATENGIEFEITHNKNGNVDMYAIYRTDGVDTELIGIKYASNSDSKIEVIDTTKAEFGKKYTYKVVPYDINPSYKNFLTVENFETFENDIFGLKTTDANKTTINFDYNQYTVDGIVSKYTTDGDAIEGAYSEINGSSKPSVYSLDKNRYTVEFGKGCAVDNKGAKLDQPLLYVREWDITEGSDKTTWEHQADTKVKTAVSSAGVSRVFSLQVVSDEAISGSNADGSLVEAGDDLYATYLHQNKDGHATQVDIPVYIQLDKSWGSNIKAYAICNGNTDDEVLNVSVVDNPNGLPAGRYAKLVLDKFYYGPYAIYADKLENAGTNNSELCETCGKQKDECTCEKKDEETKPEDTTKEDNKNNASGTNGTQTGGNTSSGTSHGYKTGDVASAGLLQSAFGMLAAAGSTLMGLFRKKKDRE